MIKHISNINFKAFYTRKNELYSDSQNRCIENIKKELGDLTKSKDFEVQAGKGDTVELYHIEGLREGIGVEDSYCRYASIIGTFDENHPFKVGDFKKWQKEEKILAGFIGFVSATITKNFFRLPELKFYS